MLIQDVPCVVKLFHILPCLPARSGGCKLTPFRDFPRNKPRQITKIGTNLVYGLHIQDIFSYFKKMENTATAVIWALI